jgi:hypothetical protein
VDHILRDLLNIAPDYRVSYVALRSDWPAWLLAALVVLAGAFAVFVYFREKSVGFARRLFLAGLRTLLYTLILCMLFSPVVGLHKSAVVRRNLLVLADRSESMAIADKRANPSEIAEAALALGKADFVLPELQEAIAATQRAVLLSMKFLKQSRWEDARQAQRAAQQGMEAAIEPARKGGKEGTGAASARAAAAAVSLQEMANVQRAACEEAEKLERSAATDLQRCQRLLKAQEDLQRNLASLLAEVSSESVRAAVDLSAEAASVKRLEIAKGLLSHARFAPLERAGQRFHLHYFTFGESLAEIGGDAPLNSLLSSVEATETSTLAAQIRNAVARYGGQPIAGVVVLTDGAFNDESLDPRSVAAALGEQGIPLYPVGIGLPAPPDVGLRSLVVQDAFFPKDKITARVQVFANGYEGIATELRVLIDGQEVGKQRVVLTREPRFVDVAFNVPDNKSGLLNLEVVVPEQPGEISVANNRIHQPVRILNQKINVLYVEGKPRWEYRYLRTVLQRDRRLNVKFLLAEGDRDLPASSPEYLARFPGTAEDAFRFDLVILGDVPFKYFNTEQVLRMVELVQKRGGSLLMLAGSRFAPSTYVGTPIADLLPVKISDEYVQPLPQEYPALTSTGKRSFTMLENTADNTDKLWSLVRPLHRLPRLKGAKPAALVLAELPATGERPEASPLIAWQRAGTGKAMYVGVDELWRLRYKKGDEFHGMFWTKAIQFLALSRLLGENKRIQLEVERNELRPGQRVQVRASVLDETFQPAKASQYRVAVDRVSAGGGGAAKAARSELTLAAAPGTPGLFQGLLTVQEEGRYVIQALGEDPQTANSVEILVSASKREQQEPAVQEALLRQMADLSGGRYLSIKDWPALAGVLEGQLRTIVESKEIDLWDNWIPYVLFVLLAGTEWLVRRKSYLV